MENNRRRIASLALFRNLYNEGRSDVMTILCEFVKNIVYNKQLRGFTPTQIKNELQNEYDFYLPEYVVESVLRKFCRKERSMYYQKIESSSQKVNEQEINNIEKSHETINSKLISYIEEKTSRVLSDKEKETLFQSFCSFIIEESDVEYSNYISTFIIETQDDAKLSNLLRTIKEGVVLYTGIQYNDTVNEIGSWQDDFTIFVEQEILFHLAGYNGTLYRQLFFDFFELVKEINQKAHKHLVKIKYFSPVKNEIEKFFNIAERIVDGKETLDCSNIAMTTIVQGCEHKSDVLEKKVNFFDHLKQCAITEENENLYLNDNHQFNIFHSDNLVKLSEELPERDIEWSLKLLNYISLIRKGNVSGFEKSKCILLTGNSTTMKIALHPLIKRNGDVPLATTMDYITNKLWFKLNKGFGSDTYPKSFNIVTKAQIVLSTQINGSVSREFERIKKEILEKNKEESVIVAELAELKARVRKPEDIQKNGADEFLSIISFADTERYLRERELERFEAENQKKKNEKLELEMLKIKKDKETNESNAADRISEKEKEVFFYKEQLDRQRKDQIRAIENRKKKADIEIEKKINIVRWIPIAVIVLYIIGVTYFTYQIGWEKVEFITWVFSTLILMLPYGIVVLKGKSWDPRKYIIDKYKKKYMTRIYSKYDVDELKLKKLKEDRGNAKY